VDCVVYVEGSVTKVTGRDVGIYVNREYQDKIKDLQGRRVRVLVIIDDCEKVNTNQTTEG
jgi:ssDNA-binding replication factor A large subunit